MLKFIDNLGGPAAPLMVTVRNRGGEDVTEEALPLVVTSETPSPYTIRHVHFISPSVYEVYDTSGLRAFLDGYFTELSKAGRGLTLEMNGGREVE